MSFIQHDVARSLAIRRRWQDEISGIQVSWPRDEGINHAVAKAVRHAKLRSAPREAGRVALMRIDSGVEDRGDEFLGGILQPPKMLEIAHREEGELSREGLGESADNGATSQVIAGYWDFSSFAARVGGKRLDV